MLALFIPLCASDAITHHCLHPAKSLETIPEGQKLSLKQAILDPRPSIEEDVGNRLTLQKAFGVIPNLPDKMRELYALRYVQMCTQAEAAVILGVSQASISRQEKALIAKIRSGVFE